MLEALRKMLSDYRLTAAAEGSAPETLRTQTQCIARFCRQRFSVCRP